MLQESDRSGTNRNLQQRRFLAVGQLADVSRERYVPTHSHWKISEQHHRNDSLKEFAKLPNSRLNIDV